MRLNHEITFDLYYFMAYLLQRYFAQHSSSVPVARMGVSPSAQIVSKAGHSYFSQVTTFLLQWQFVHLSGVHQSPSIWPSSSQTKHCFLETQVSLTRIFSPGQKHPSTDPSVHLTSRPDSMSLQVSWQPKPQARYSRSVMNQQKHVAIYRRFTINQ